MGFHIFPGRAISEQELDRQCEAYLKQRFGEELDFAISGSLAALTSDGIVQRNAEVIMFDEGQSIDSKARWILRLTIDGNVQRDAQAGTPRHSCAGLDY